MTRFLSIYSSYVDKGPYPKGCWLWTGSVDKDGYGLCIHKGKLAKAHRVSFKLAHPAIDIVGWLVMHTCDTPGCIRPAHLVKGTHALNAQDRENKGRGFFQLANPNKMPGACVGIRNSNSKLSAKDVCVARKAFDRGVAIRTLAKRFGVSYACIQFVVHNRTWRHLSLSKRGAKRKIASRLKFVPRLVREIRIAYSKGATLKSLGIAHGVSFAAIHAMITRRTYKAVK